MLGIKEQLLAVKDYGCIKSEKTIVVIDEYTGERYRLDITAVKLDPEEKCSDKYEVIKIGSLE